MRGSIQDVPVVMELDGIVIRQTECGTMNVGLERFPAGTDTEPVFKGLPDDRCQCPHWGYVVKGRLRVRYADREETLRAGDAYYLAPGHLPIFDEDTELIEFSPLGEYQRTMAVVAQNVAAAQQAAGAPS
ncbi:MAG TPA: cupin domain-containing protein [Dehalococcoidia bacterium]|nr:cupin domain-containing protein [Dehalococcoidia bacterium]